MRAKVDTTAIVHAALMNENSINVYRISVSMKDPVDPAVLQCALNTMVKRYPMICCRMANDSFWYYTESLGKITLMEDDNRILASLNHKNVFQQAVNIMYSGNKIIMEAFHSVTDGHGAFTFMNGLLGEYVNLKYTTGAQTICWGIASEGETEDGFIRHGNAIGTQEKVVNIQRPFAFPKLYPGDPVNFTTFRLNTKEMKKLAKQNQCTLNELIIAMIYGAIFTLKDTDGKDIVLTVPINLRNKFESQSLRNFTHLASTAIRKAERTLEELIREIRTQIHRQNNREYLHKAITKIARLEKNMMVKISPIWLKNFIIRAAVKFGADKSCMTVSNLGDLSYMLSDAGEYISHVDIMLSPRRNSAYNCCISTIGEKMNITFTHSAVEDSFLQGVAGWLKENRIEYATQLH